MNSAQISLPESLIFCNEFSFFGEPSISYDLTLLYPEIFKKAVLMEAGYLSLQNVNKIIGLSCSLNRSLIFASAIANQLHLPLGIAGEAGTMPGAKISEPLLDQRKHKQQDIEIARIAIQNNDRYGIVTDIITSGASMEAAIRLLTIEPIKANPEIKAITSLARFHHILEQSDFKHRLKLINNYSTYCLMDIAPDLTVTVNPSHLAPYTRKHVNNANLTVEKLRNFVRIFERYPSNEIDWTDVMPLLLSPEALDSACNLMLEASSENKIGPVDGYVSVGVRGHYFTPIMALKTNKPLLIADKASRIVANRKNLLSQDYNMEYNDTDDKPIMGMNQQILDRFIRNIRKTCPDRNPRVVIADDIIATGGTVDAVIKILQQAGIDAAGIIGLIKINGAYKNHPNSKKDAIEQSQIPVITLLDY